MKLGLKHLTKATLFLLAIMILACSKTATVPSVTGIYVCVFPNGEIEELNLRSDSTFVQKLWKDLNAFVYESPAALTSHTLTGTWGLNDNHIEIQYYEYFSYHNPYKKNDPPKLCKTSGKYSGLVWLGGDKTSTGETGIEINPHTGYYMVRIEERQQVMGLAKWNWISETELQK